MKKFVSNRTKNRAVVLSALVLTAGMLLGGCKKPAFLNKEDDSPLTVGMNAIAAGDFGLAMSTFGSAEGRAKDSSEEKLLKRGMGMAALGQNDYEKAIEYFEEALSISNGILKKVDVDISYYLAVAKYKSGDIEGAVNTYTAILELYPNEDNACYLRGKANLALGNKVDAVADYDRAIEINPKDYNHYVRICKDLSEAGYASDGTGYIKRALDSGDKLSDYQMGVFNYYLGDYSAARNNLEKAREGKEISEDMILYLGKTYEKLGDPGYAISLYENYILSNPQSAGCYVNIGLTKMTQRDYEGALEAFETGLATGNETYKQSLLFNRIVAYERLNDFATAKELCAEYVKEYPQDAKALRENQFLSTR